MHASDVDALVKQAVAHQKAGRIGPAEKLFQQALALDPQHCAALQFCGLLCQQRGNDAAALDLMRRSVAEAPGADQPHYHNNLATAYGRAGRLDDAMKSIDHALSLKRDYAEAWGNKGVVLDRLGRTDEAVDAFRTAIEIKPDAADAHANLGSLLARHDRTDEAIDVLGRAADRFPRHAEISVNLGNALRRVGRMPEAVAALRRAVERRPDFPEAHNNLGVALHDSGSLEEAERTLRKAIELRRDYADAHWNLALVLLHKGDFHNGWMEYEWRRHLKEDSLQRRDFPQPQWNGGPLRDRTVLVLCEQGLGDTLQFVRYAKVLSDRGAKVIVECQPRLANLMRGVDGVHRVAARGEPLPPFDCHVRLLSIPGIVGTDADSVPANVPYVRVADDAVRAWREKLDAIDPARGFRVGIAWQGNPQYRGDAQRSIPLSAFEPLAAIEGVRLFSLQKGKGDEQAGPLTDRLPLHRFDPALDEAAGAFFDTAAVMLNLDLVVTSDTSIAHLAGALGAATWLALPFACDWRWQGGRDDSPWYPTARLFRQRVRDDWGEVFGRIAGALGEAVAARAGRPQAAAPPAAILAPVSAGELVDKITILRIKAERIADTDRLAHVRAELAALEVVRHRDLRAHGADLAQVERELLHTNPALWDVEDALRLCEAAGEFGDRFVDLARSVYRHNDHRSALKRRVNELAGSMLVEQKQYAGERGTGARRSYGGVFASAPAAR